MTSQILYHARSTAVGLGKFIKLCLDYSILLGFVEVELPTGYQLRTLEGITGIFIKNGITRCFYVIIKG